VPTRPLPNDPFFEHLKSQAKRLLAGVRAGEAALAHYKLADAQITVARSYGLASWPKLKRLMAELGFELSALSRNTALHQVA
jgi:hypothetical protein